MVAANGRPRGCAIITASRTRPGRRYWIYREGLIGDGRGGLPEWYHARPVRMNILQRSRLMPEQPGIFAAEAGADRRHAAAADRAVRLMSSWASAPPFSFLRGASDAIELVRTAP